MSRETDALRKATLAIAARLTPSPPNVQSERIVEREQEAQQERDRGR